MLPLHAGTAEGTSLTLLMEPAFVAAADIVGGWRRSARQHAQPLSSSYQVALLPLLSHQNPSPAAAAAPQTLVHASRCTSQCPTAARSARQTS